MGADELDWAAEMAALGVRPFERGARKPAHRGPAQPDSRVSGRGSPTSPAKGKAAEPRRAEPSATRPSGEATRATATPPPKPTARATPSVRHEREGVAEVFAALDAANAELVRVRAELSAVLTERDRAQQTLSRSNAQVAALSAEVAELQAAPRLPASAERGLTLANALAERGAAGDSEALMLLRALDESGRLAALIHEVGIQNASDISRWLDEHTAVLGDCGACPSTGQRAVLRVPRARCEVCQGSDIRRSCRRFLDACLAAGITRVTLVGGSPKYHRQLRELLAHHRLKLKVVPGNVRRSAVQARHDVEGSDLVIVWGATALDHALSDLYTDLSARGKVWTAPHRGILGMLDAMSDRLESPDASSP